MNKRTAIILSVVAALIVLAIGVALAGLFAPSGSGRSGQNTGKAEILDAVPSDAAALMQFSSLSNALEFLSDDRKVFSGLFDDRFQAFLKGAAADKSISRVSGEAVISFHFSGSMVPMLACQAKGHESDSLSTVGKILTLARESGLRYRVYDATSKPIILVSSSETLADSGLRHLYGGHSICENPRFEECLKSVNSHDAIFINHEYSGKIRASFLDFPAATFDPFVRKFASWSALAMTEIKDDSMVMKGIAVAEEGKGAFIHALDTQKGGSSAVASVAPLSTFSFVSLVLSDQKAYRDGYLRFLDASAQAEKYKSSLQSLRKASGTDPAAWADRMGIRELAKVNWTDSDKSFSAVFVRTSSKKKDGSDLAPSMVPAIFGSMFLTDTVAVRHEEWIVYGSADAMENALEFIEGGEVLSTKTGKSGILPAKSALVVYDDMAAGEPGRYFGRNLRKSAMISSASVAFEPVVLSYGPAGLRFEARRILAVSRKTEDGVKMEAVVEVPSGPFPVEDISGDEGYMLRQNPNNSLSFVLPSGKAQWSIPFPGRLCGNVESVDFFDNGRIQFLFCSGSKLYLLDRQGRFVNKFPVDLGKPVVLGPVLTDGGKAVLVVHADNSIGKYSLEGKADGQWQGISCDDTIISLPELVTVKDKDWYVVRTAAKALVYPLEGGAPKISGKGGKAISPNSTIFAEKNGIRVTCVDGKERILKL